MKPKHKILSKALALAGAFLTSLTLSVTALADFVAANGHTNVYVGAASSATMFSYGNFSWRVSLYVSTSDDGTIDPNTASIVTGNGLYKVGTILYSTAFDYSADPGIVFVPATIADSKRAAAAEMVTLAGRALTGTYPLMSQITYRDKQVPHSNLTNSGETIYLSKELPTGLSSTKPLDSATFNRDHSTEFTETVIEHMNEKLGGTLALKVAELVGSKPREILTPLLTQVSNGTLSIDEALAPLLPTSEDCVVEWLCTAEPLINAHTNNDSDYFEIRYCDPASAEYKNAGAYTTNQYCQAFLGEEIFCCLDAYDAVWYNEHAKAVYDDYYISTFIKKHFPNFNRTADRYQTNGKLRYEMGDATWEQLGGYTFDKHDGAYYCGVPVAGAMGHSWFVAGKETFMQNPTTYAMYGGIAVLTTKLDDPDIPVYTHTYTYTPGNPNPTIFTSQTDTVPPTQAYISVDSAHR